jgi:hypothetical protein
MRRELLSTSKNVFGVDAPLLDGVKQGCGSVAVPVVDGSGKTR